MKKLMITAFAVAFAAVAQAATCSWNTGALKTVDKDGKWTTTALYGSGSTITATAYLYSDALCTELIGSGEASNVGPTSALSGSFFSSGTTKAVVDYSTTYYVKIMMTGDFGNGEEQTFTATSPVAFTTPGKGTPSANFTTLGVINTSSSSAQWSAVPEPTSAMLLLLGMAGLALKRKQK